MNSYLVFFQDGEDDLSRDYVEVNAEDPSQAEDEILQAYPDKQIIQVWERAL